MYIYIYIEGAPCIVPVKTVHGWGQYQNNREAAFLFLDPKARLFSDPGNKHILAGLNGNMIGSQKEKKGYRNATERPREVCNIMAFWALFRCSGQVFLHGWLSNLWSPFGSPKY